jgi:hypothetical protein
MMSPHLLKFAGVGFNPFYMYIGLTLRSYAFCRSHISKSRLILGLYFRNTHNYKDSQQASGYFLTDVEKLLKRLAENKISKSYT